MTCSWSQIISSVATPLPFPEKRGDAMPCSRRKRVIAQGTVMGQQLPDRRGVT